MMYGSQRDGAPQTLPLPQYSPFGIPQANSWNGNQLQIPGAGGLAQMLNPNLPPIPTPVAPAAQKKQKQFDPLIGGLFGILPGMFAAGNTQGGLFGGLAGLLGGLGK